MKTIKVLEVFTEEMIEDAKKCKDVEEIEMAVIRPNLWRINLKTGQTNVPAFWAYAMQSVLNQLDKGV